MITPGGGLTASALWTALKAGTRVNVKLTFSNGTVLNDEDIKLDGGISISDIFNGDTDVVFGKAVCKQFKTYILNSSKLTDLPWSDEFTVQFGVTISNTTYWTTVGIFSGEKPSNVTTNDVIEFTAYDRMKMFDVLADDFVKGLTYPKTVGQIYTALCSYVGIQSMAGDELANAYARSFSSAPADMEGYTCRDVLAWIAEACGCYAKINANGKCQLRWFTDNTSHAITAGEEFDYESGDVNDGLIWNEADLLDWDEIDLMTWDDVCGYEEAYGIDQLLVKQLDNDLDINFPAALGGNVYMIVDNPFLAVTTENDITNYINPIYQRLKTFGGHLPVRVECIGDFTVEAGDIVSVTIGNNTLNVPVFVKEMKWNGFVEDEYETTGQKDRPTYTTEKNKQKVLNSKEIRFIVEQNYYSRQSGIIIDTDGVKISGGRYIDIGAGSSLKIESDGSISVKAGGSFTVDSGNFGIDDNGNVDLKGNVEISSGKKLTVKSSGDLKVESGGGIDINASGNLKLTGSVVEIKSGSTFEVNSTNFKIDSVNKKMTAGQWTFDDDGVVYDNPDSTIDFQIANESNRGENKIGLFYDVVDHSSYKSGDLKFVTAMLDLYGYATSSIFLMQVRYTNGEGYSQNFIAQYLPNFQRCIGATTDKWDYGYFVNLGRIDSVDNYIKNAYIDKVTYVTLVQNSSKDIKHDIKPLENCGEQIDRLFPVTFVYDSDKNEKTRMGLIYEDTVEVMPGICTNDESSKAINYVELIPALVKEIQQLRIRVKELEEREEE